MNSEFSERDQEIEVKDRTRLVWAGVIVLMALLAVVVWLWGRQPPVESTVWARHILISYDMADPADRDRAYRLVTELKERLAKGEKFATLAREYSDDPYSAQRGGDLGPSVRGKYVDKVEDYVWSAPLKQVSDVIQTEFGFHLVEVLDRYISPKETYQEEIQEQVLGGESTAAP